MKTIILDYKSGAQALASKAVQPEKDTDTIIKEALGPLIEQIHNRIWMEDHRDKATKEDTLGVMIAKYLEWDGYAISRVAKSAFEDANFRDMVKVLDESLPEK